MSSSHPRAAEQNEDKGDGGELQQEQPPHPLFAIIELRWKLSRPNQNNKLEWSTNMEVVYEKCLNMLYFFGKFRSFNA